jgi:hypothetical protein
MGNKMQRTQIFVELELNDKNKMQRTAISCRLRCAAPLRAPTAFLLQILSRRCRFLLELHAYHNSSLISSVFSFEKGPATVVSPERKLPK